MLSAIDCRRRRLRTNNQEMEHTIGGSRRGKKKNPDMLEQTLANRLCRICYAPEEASGTDPILLLGCTCKGDISYGHQSCLKKWFRMRFQRNRNLDCEVCRSPLGAPLKEIIRSFITTEVIQHAPQLLLLLQLPPSDLDHLQLPLRTPGFSQLPSETQRSLEASFERLVQEQRRGQRRRREAFETSLESQTIEPQNIDADEDHLRLQDMLVNDFLELTEVQVQLDPPYSTLLVPVFTEVDNPRIHRLEPGEDSINPLGGIGYPEGPVVRVPIFRPHDIMHPRSVEEMLDEVSRQVLQVVDLYGEDLTLLPNYLDSLFLEVNQPLLMSPLREPLDNGDDTSIPIANPVVLDNLGSEGGPHPAFAEAAGPTDSVPRRDYTYGRFQMFQLLQ